VASIHLSQFLQCPRREELRDRDSERAEDLDLGVSTISATLADLALLFATQRRWSFLETLFVADTRATGRRDPLSSF